MRGGVCAAQTPRCNGVVGWLGDVFSQINSQTERDVLKMESIAVPVSFAVLCGVRGLVAAALPVVVGGLAIVGSLSVLRLIAMTTDVSIFALNLATALGLALAIDYTLLIVSRYRDELAQGAIGKGTHPDDAHRGRTWCFRRRRWHSRPRQWRCSDVFPHVVRLRRRRHVALCALAALVVTPAAIVLLGPRWTHSTSPRRAPAAAPRRAAAETVRQLFWYRWAKSVMRHAVVIGLAVSAVLIVLGLPFLESDGVSPTIACYRLRVGASGR